MSRSNTSKSSLLSGMSEPYHYELQQAYDQAGQRIQCRSANGYSASNDYGTPVGQSTGAITQQQQFDEVVFEPSDFVSKISHHPNIGQFAAQRQRGEGLDPSSLPSYSYNISPCTSMSSNLSPYNFTMSEDMSRQSSMTSSSVVDMVDMSRVCSSFSVCSDAPFPIDEEEDDDLNDSFLSSTTQKRSSSSDATTCYDDSSLLGNMGQGAVGLQQHFFCSSVDAMSGGQYYDQEMTKSEDMRRTTSTQSNSSVSSAELRASQRRQKQIENGRRPIVSKSLPDGPTSNEHSKQNRLRPLRAEEPGAKRKEPIAKQTYVRPQHPKLRCELCNEFPAGFRGEHELRRHQDRAHAQKRKVWICVDPHTITPEGWRPQRPLDICKQCKQQKQYNPRKSVDESLLQEGHPALQEKQRERPTILVSKRLGVARLIMPFRN